MMPTPGAGQPRRNPKRVRRECQARLAALAIPAGCGIGALCDQLSQQRGRPIHRLPVPLQGSAPYGCWMSAADADFIFYEANTSRLHQEHIIAHELGHMICCHQGYAMLDSSTSRLLFPDLAPRLVQDILQRSSYSSGQEQEAEIMAYLILGLANSPGRVAAESGETSEIVTRIARSLRPP